MGKFLDNRLKFHTASRVGAQTGYSLAQALDPDGHIVRHNSVWTAETSEFPMNVSTTTDPKDATDDLVTVFKNGATVNRVVGGGNVYRNPAYPAVELYERVTMTGVANSDGEDSGGTYQSYEIQENGARVMNWCAPTAVINPTTGKPVAGFSGIAEASKDGSTWTVLQKVSNWALATGAWEFVYIAGILMFEPSVTPSKLSYTSVRFTGFRYIGATMDTTIKDIEDKINNIQFIWEEDPAAPTVAEVEQFTISKVTLLSGNDNLNVVAAMTGKTFTKNSNLAYSETSSGSSGTDIKLVLDNAAPASLIDFNQPECTIKLNSAEDNPFDSSLVWTAKGGSTYRLEFTFA